MRDWPSPPTWPELVVLMGFGRGQDLSVETVAGQVRVRDPFLVPDHRYDLDHAETHAPARSSDVPGLVQREKHWRLEVRGDAYRVETTNGLVRLIERPDVAWFFRPDGIPRRFRDGYDPLEEDGLPVELSARLEPSHWESFDPPRSGVVAIEFLGRPAWLAEAESPTYVFGPRRVVVDDETGWVLSYLDDRGRIVEFTSVEFGLELSAEMYDWDGPTRSERADFDYVYGGGGTDGSDGDDDAGDDADDDADDDEDFDEDGGSLDQHLRRQVARSREWLADRGVGDVRIEVPLTLLVEDDSADGSFETSFDIMLSGSLLRRPASDAPWPGVDSGDGGDDDDGENGWEHGYRWRDGAWDWFLGADGPVSQAQLAAVQRQLRNPPT